MSKALEEIEGLQRQIMSLAEGAAKEEARTLPAGDRQAHLDFLLQAERLANNGSYIAGVLIATVADMAGVLQRCLNCHCELQRVLRGRGEGGDDVVETVAPSVVYHCKGCGECSQTRCLECAAGVLPYIDCQRGR